MNKLDDNLLFVLRGDTFQDVDTLTTVTNNGMTNEQIVDEYNGETPVKCIYFNNDNYLSMNIDGGFFQEPFTIEWWEKDMGDSTLSSTFANVVTGSNPKSFGLLSGQSRNNLSMSSNSTDYFIDNFRIGARFGQVKEWVHRALVFDGSRYTAFTNGRIFDVLISGEKCFNVSTFQMGRWRATPGTLNKKIYNFVVSKGAKWENEFTPNPTQLGQEPTVEISELDESATTTETIEKLAEIIDSLHFKSNNKIEPIIDLDLASFRDGDTSIANKQGGHLNMLIGTTRGTVTKAQDGVMFKDGAFAMTKFSNINKKGTIVMTVDSLSPIIDKFGRLLRTETDAFSLFLSEDVSSLQFKKWIGSTNERDYLKYEYATESDINNKRIIVTYNQFTGKASMYIDGVLQSSGVYTDMPQSHSIIIGNDNTKEGDIDCNYSIDFKLKELKIYTECIDDIRGI